MEELETQGGVVSVFVDIDFVLGLGCQFSVLDNAYQGFRLAVLVLYQLFHFYVWTASLVLSKSFCSSALLYLRSKKRAEQTLELFLTEDHYVKMNRLCRFALRRKQKAVNELSLLQRIIGKLVSPTKSYLRSNIMAVHNILNSNWIKSKLKWTCSQVTSLSWNETKRYTQTFSLHDPSVNSFTRKSLCCNFVCSQSLGYLWHSPIRIYVSLSMSKYRTK